VSRFVLMHLPGKITYKEIDEMIATVDKNEDWKISYSEFRVSYLVIMINKLGLSWPSSGLAGAIYASCNH
jgi:hypothetical protein